MSTLGKSYQDRYRRLKESLIFDKYYDDDFKYFMKHRQLNPDTKAEAMESLFNISYSGNVELFRKIKDYYENATGAMPSDATIKGWVIGRSSIPPIHTLAIFADHYKTNIGYLLGLHSCQRMENNSITPSFDYTSWEKDYRESHYGLSICNKSTGIKKTWFQLITSPEGRNIPSHESAPFIRLAKALDCSLDFLLGLSKYPHWETYEFINAPYNICNLLRSDDYFVYCSREDTDRFMSLERFVEYYDSYDERYDEELSKLENEGLDLKEYDYLLPSSPMEECELYRINNGHYTNLMEKYKYD